MLLGTLDMLVLRALVIAPAHGHTIAHVIEKTSDEALQVEHGSLYPAFLIITEIAATAVLLVTSGLLIKSFANLSGVDPGFQPERALSLHLAIGRAKYRDDAAVARYLGQVIGRLRAIPGVDSVGVVNRLPMGGQSQSNAIQFEHSPATPLMIDSRID